MPRSSTRLSPITTTLARSFVTPEASSLALISGPMPVTSPSMRPMTGFFMSRFPGEEAGEFADAFQLFQVENHVHDLVGIGFRQLTPGSALAELAGEFFIAHRVGGAAFAEIGAAADFPAAREFDVDDSGHFFVACSFGLGMHAELDLRDHFLH